MKVMVIAKRVVNFNIKVRLKADGSGVETANVKMGMNPFDEIAVEEAVQLKEKGIASEVVIVSLGEKVCTDVIYHGLALGADRGILIETSSPLEPLAVAKLLKALVHQENPQLIILGKQAIDTDNNQTGQMLAALLDWPQGTFISKLTIENEEAHIEREIDGGLESLSLKLPCVLTTDLRLNTPRYATLPNIMKAKKKEVTTLTPESLGVQDIAPRVKTLKMALPPTRKAGIKVASVSELIDKLKNEAKVI